MQTRTHVSMPPAVLALLVFGYVAALFPPFTASGLPPWPPPAPGVVGAAPAPAPVAAPAVVPAVLSRASGRPEYSRTVALTFDDGPDPRWTPQVLELLARHGAVATFCLVGENAARHEDLVRRIVDAGMRVCNHTHTHDTQLATGSEDLLIREVVDPKADLARLSGAPISYFRAPGGNWAESIQRTSAEHGMQPLGWSVDALDWRRPGAAEIARRIQDQMHPGAIVLLHDGGGSREQTVAALEQLLPWLVENCYAFGFPTA